MQNAKTVQEEDWMKLFDVVYVWLFSVVMKDGFINDFSCKWDSVASNWKDWRMGWMGDYSGFPEYWPCGLKRVVFFKKIRYQDNDQWLKESSQKSAFCKQSHNTMCYSDDSLVQGKYISRIIAMRTDVPHFPLSVCCLSQTLFASGKKRKCGIKY